MMVAVRQVERVDAATFFVVEGHRDGKARVIPKKLFKIGEVMRYSKLSRQTIHNYTMLGLITEEERTEAGHRLYGEEVFAQIEHIKQLQVSKTLKEIKEILKNEAAE